MGAAGLDVQLSTAAREFFPYGVECKNRAAIAVYADFAQASVNAESGGLEPLLVIKQNHSEPLAVITLTHFMELVHEAAQLRNLNP